MRSSRLILIYVVCKSLLLSPVAAKELTVQKMQNSLWKTFATVLLYYTQPVILNPSHSCTKICWLNSKEAVPDHLLSLQKHAYSSILKTFQQKNENFPIKNSDISLISAQNINCGYSLEPPQRGGSNEYPQSMFWAEIRKIMCTPVNPRLIYESGV